MAKFLKIKTKKKKLPTGKIATVDIIDHPGAALIIPFLTKNKVILIRQYRPAIEKYIYEFPAGTIDPGENALQCARREIVEEVGYAAKKFTNLGTIYPVPGYSTERIVLYKGEELSEKEIDFDTDEVITSKPYTKQEVIKIFRSGKILDAKTISALAYIGWV